MVRAAEDGGSTSWRSGELRILGVHSATDANHSWPEYGAMLGARFDGHPWTQDFAIDVVDPDHPATAHLGPSGAGATRSTSSRTCGPTPGSCSGWPTDQVDLSVPGGRVPDCGFPLAWCVEDGAAAPSTRALGHFPGAWETPGYLRHLAGGLAWLGENA